ncbi:MAG: hypothetical protein ACR2NU_02425, partial [Aeoliella sp.]
MLDTTGGETQRFEKPLTITAAASSDSSLLIAFDVDGQAKYMRGSRENKQNISTHLDWFPVYQLLPEDSDSFAAEIAVAESISFHQAELWQAVRQAIFEQLTPSSTGEGTLLNYRDIEYVSYRSNDGRLTGVDLKRKPAQIPIVQRYRLDAMTDSM